MLRIPDTPLVILSWNSHSHPPAAAPSRIPLRISDLCYFLHLYHPKSSQGIFTLEILEVSSSNPAWYAGDLELTYCGITQVARVESLKQFLENSPFCSLLSCVWPVRDLFQPMISSKMNLGGKFIADDEDSRDWSMIKTFSHSSHSFTLFIHSLIHLLSASYSASHISPYIGILGLILPFNVNPNPVKLS